MLYRTTHVTRYLYEEPVSQCLSEARLTPRSFDTQRVIESQIRLDPEPVSWDQRKDYFGNDVSTFTVFQMHDRAFGVVRFERTGHGRKKVSVLAEAV